MGAALKKDRGPSIKSSVPIKKQSTNKSKPKRSQEIDQQLSQLRERSMFAHKRSKEKREVLLAPSILQSTKGTGSTSPAAELGGEGEFVPFHSSQEASNQRVANMFAALDVEGESELLKIVLRPATLGSNKNN